MYRLVFILCLLGQVGCVTPTRTAYQDVNPSSKRPLTDGPPGREWDGLVRVGQEPLSDSEFQDLAMAANRLALSGDSLPDRLVRRLEPVEVYHDLANVVVALYRDAHEERGYYIVPAWISYLPANDRPGWTWERLTLNSPQDIYSFGLYEYSRRW
jgi:hypothetical protein